MCNPVAVQVGIAAVSAMATMYGQDQNNKAIEEAAERQQEQINDQAAERTQQRMEEARALRSAMRASAAEAAVSGNSVELLANDIMAQAGRDVALIEKNRRNGVVESGSEARARIRTGNAEALGGVTATAAGSCAAVSAEKIGGPGIGMSTMPTS